MILHHFSLQMLSALLSMKLCLPEKLEDEAQLFALGGVCCHPRGRGLGGNGAAIALPKLRYSIF
jgi:hypothetical protein